MCGDKERQSPRPCQLRCGFGFDVADVTSVEDPVLTMNQREYQCEDQCEEEEEEEEEKVAEENETCAVSSVQVI